MAHVLTGSDVLSTRDFSDLAGLKIGFVGNHTSRLSDGTPTRLAMHRSPNVSLVKLFSPEHGAFGREDREGIPDDVDPETGLPILSLYGETRKPTLDMLAGIDALVFEIQDIGARFYTYSATLLLCLEAAHEANIQFIVLDRPNPITGRHAEGPLPDPDRLSFVVSYNMPVRHGLTLGELARIAGAERGIDAGLSVIPCQDWRRDLWWDETGVPWIDPSPAMRSLDAATLYPGVCLIEQTNMSVGRGTEMPFTMAGAPWIDSKRWADAINASAGPGVTATPHEFVPNLRRFKDEICHGVRLSINYRHALNSVRLGLAMIVALRDVHGDQYEIKNVITLLANREVQDQLEGGASVDEIHESFLPGIEAWIEREQPYRLYE